MKCEIAWRNKFSQKGFAVHTTWSDKAQAISQAASVGGEVFVVVDGSAYAVVNNSGKHYSQRPPTPMERAEIAAIFR